jgi:hypothetical protein
MLMKIEIFLTLFIHNYNYLPYADFKAAANFDFFLMQRFYGIHFS